MAEQVRTRNGCREEGERRGHLSLHLGLGHQWPSLVNLAVPASSLCFGFFACKMGTVLITKLLGRDSLVPAACLALHNQELKTIAFAGEDPLGLEIEGLLKRRALL